SASMPERKPDCLLVLLPAGCDAVRWAVVPHCILSEVGDGLIEVEGRRCLQLGPDHGFRAHRASVASIWRWRFHGGDPECPRIFRPVYTLYEDYARPDWAGRARITTLHRFL